MDDLTVANWVMLLFRCGIGGVMLAHGINHIFGPGRIEGTAKWFGSMGMRPPLTQAWLASITEVGAGVLLVLGLLTPFGSAGVLGTMSVAWIIAHRKNGFFIFRPGQGWEYVMTLWLCGLLIASLGPGEYSLDDAFDISNDLSGGTGFLIALLAGVGGALLLLAACWRPPADTPGD